MTGRLYTRAAPLKAGALGALLDRFESGWAYLEREDAVKLARLPLEEQLGDYSVGRVFNAEAELRWQEVEAGAFAVQMLQEGGETPVEFDLSAEFETSEVYPVRLWGTLVRYLDDAHILHAGGGDTQQVWIETRIPRPLRYPAEDAAWVQVHARDYAAGGVVVATRWLELEGIER